MTNRLPSRSKLLHPPTGRIMKGLLPVAYQVLPEQVLQPGDILNRKQLDDKVDWIVLNPGRSQFVSCPMFVFRPCGLHACCLDDVHNIYVDQIRIGNQVQAILGLGSIPLQAFIDLDKSLVEESYTTCSPNTYLTLTLRNEASRTQRIKAWFSGIYFEEFAKRGEYMPSGTGFKDS